VELWCGALVYCTANHIASLCSQAVCILGDSVAPRPGVEPVSVHRIPILDPKQGGKVVKIVSQSAVLKFLEKVLPCTFCMLPRGSELQLASCITQPSESERCGV